MPHLSSFARYMYISIYPFAVATKQNFAKVNVSAAISCVCIQIHVLAACCGTIFNRANKDHGAWVWISALVLCGSVCASVLANLRL